MLIIGGDSSGTLSVVGSDDGGAPSVEHLRSSLLRDLIELTRVGPSHALRSPPESVLFFLPILVLEKDFKQEIS